MAQFRVIGAVAVVRGQNKSERYLYRDAVFEDDGLDEATMQHLQNVGLIEELVVVDLEAEAAEAERLEAEKKAAAGKPQPPQK